MIEQLAQRIVRELRVTTPPITVDCIANHLDCTVDYYPFKEISGLCHPQNKWIAVKKDLPRVIRRFTAVHELSHIILGHQKGLFMFSATHFKEDKEASRLAAALLVPKSLLLKELETYTPEDESGVADLAEKFDVSYTVMNRRIIEVCQKLDTVTSARRMFG